MKAKYLLIIILFLFFSNAFAQKEFNNWFFGKNAAITFNTKTGNPVALTGSAMDQYEGCSSISDRSGKLLFYTNGVNVYNSKHKVMPNGSGLYGDNTSTTSAFIVKQPGSSTRYYIFTSDQGGYMIGSESNGICYSIVDMTLGGYYGDVTVKNVNLFKPATEKIAAVWHKNRHDIWIITHEWLTNAFRAYLLTDSGLVNNPVISYAGSVHNGDLTNTIGYLKSSFMGDMLAVITFGSLFELFDFNAATGFVTLNSKIELTECTPYYSVEFSRDGSKLYFDAQKDNKYYIYQLDLDKKNNGQYDITHISGARPGYGSIQRGPDDKIYIADHQHSCLSVINKPNMPKDSCNYVAAGIQLEGLCQLGLPVDIRGNAPVVIASVNKTICQGGDICLGLVLESDEVMKKVLWQGPNGFLSSDANPVIHNADTSMSGEYKVIASFGNFVDSASVIVRVNPNPLIRVSPASPVVVCEGGTARLECLSDSPGIIKYQWSTGDTTKSIIVNQPGAYKVYAIDSNGCVSDKISVEVVFHPKPVVSISPANPVPVCEGGTVRLECLSGSPGIIKYQWSTGDTTKSISVTNPGAYWVYAIDSNGCVSDKISVGIDFHPKPVVSISPASPVMICQGSEARLECISDSPGIIKYQWSTGDTTKSISVGQPGAYWAYAIDSNGCNSDKVSVRVDFYQFSVGLTSYFAGKSIPGLAYNSYFALINSGNFKVHIKSITSSAPELTIGSYKDFINPQDTVHIPYTFLPTEVKTYEFKINTELDEPCIWLDTIKLSMYSFNVAKVWMPDTVANIGDSNFELPLFVQLSYCSVPLKEGAPYRAEIRYNASLFMPDESALPQLKESRMENNERIHVFEGNLPPLSCFGPSTILAIPGQVLLGNDSVTPLYLKRFELIDTNDWMSIEAKDGSLRTTGVCEQALSRVRFYNIPTLSVQPNPAHDVVHVILTGTGDETVTLDIYSLQGIRLYSQEIEGIKPTKEIKINVENFPQGVYYITAKLSSGTVSTPFVIVE